MELDPSMDSIGFETIVGNVVFGTKVCGMLLDHGIEKSLIEECSKASYIDDEIYPMLWALPIGWVNSRENNQIFTLLMFPRIDQNLLPEHYSHIITFDSFSSVENLVRFVVNIPEVSRRVTEEDWVLFEESLSNKWEYHRLLSVFGKTFIRGYNRS